MNPDYADMTLGEAVAIITNPTPVGCACTGGRHCCRYAWAQAEALQLGAHIAVKQIAELARREGQA